MTPDSTVLTVGENAPGVSVIHPIVFSFQNKPFEDYKDSSTSNIVLSLEYAHFSLRLRK